MAKEYIERNELIENLQKFAPEHYNALINQLITKQPTADVKEVKHGEWIIDKSYTCIPINSLKPTKRISYKCSECGCKSGNNKYFKHCPKCGAKMNLSE